MVNEPLELLAQLIRFQTFVAALAGRTLAWRQRPASDEWSLTELMCHLRDVEVEVHQTRFCAILSQETPFLPGYDTNRWARERNYREQDGPAALAAFLDARETTLTMLAGVEGANWQKTGRHSFLGQTTLLELLTLAVQHEFEHWQQLKVLIG